MSTTLAQPTTIAQHPPADAPRTGPTTRGPNATLTLATVLSGLFAGFFVTYSASVVLGLAQVDDVTYVTTFQAINATIRNAAFAVFFFGCVPSIGLAIVANRRAGRTTLTLLSIGLASCAAVVVITFAGSVPLNNELATYVDVDATTASIARRDFESTWNNLNLARSVLAVAGATLVAMARPTRRAS